jgi:Ca-activated chloride channel family protein
VAVSEEPTVDPTKPVRRELMPQQLPHGMSAEGLGLRAATSFSAAGMAAPAAAAGLLFEPSPLRELARTRLGVPREPAAKRRGGSWLEGVFRSRPAGETTAPSAPRPPAPPSLAEEAAGPGAPQEEARFPERRLLAALKRLGRGRAVLEVEVKGAELAWEPPASVTLRLDDGTEREIEVDLAATTTGAALAPGQTFRLVLRIPAEVALDRAVAVLVDHGATRLVLSVRG